MNFKLSIRPLNHLFCINGLLITILLSMAITAAAQTDTSPVIYFEIPAKSVAQHSIFPVKIFADTSKPINALAVNFSYPQDVLMLRSVSTADSFIDFWRGVSPAALGNGTINFEGGTAVPFSGSGGKIGELVFEAKQQGVAHIISTKAEFYYADGAGTHVSAENIQTNILVTSGDAGTSSMSSFQTAPPPSVNVKIVSDPVDNRSLVTFAVTDKGAGIRSAQMRFLRYFLWDQWGNISNSAPIPFSTVAFQVKIVDGNGNVVEKTFYVWETLTIYVLILMGAMIVAVAGGRLICHILRVRTIKL